MTIEREHIICIIAILSESEDESSEKLSKYTHILASSDPANRCIRCRFRYINRKHENNRKNDCLEHKKNILEKNHAPQKNSQIRGMNENEMCEWRTLKLRFVAFP